MTDLQVMFLTQLYIVSFFYPIFWPFFQPMLLFGVLTYNENHLMLKVHFLI